MKRIYLLGGVLTALCCNSLPVLAQPTSGTEGKWEGHCVRGRQSVRMRVFIDQMGAKMNDIGATNFSKSGLNVGFTLPGRLPKRFEGRFSQDTGLLTGSLSAQGKSASCNMTRKIDTPNRICIKNPESHEIWWRLVPGNPPSPVRLLGGSEDRGSGAAGGKLCWGTSEAQANSCTRSLPQSSYAC